MARRVDPLVLSQGWREALAAEGLTAKQLAALNRVLPRVKAAVELPLSETDIHEAQSRLASLFFQIQSFAISKGRDSADAHAWARFFGESIGPLVDGLAAAGVDQPLRGRALTQVVDPDRMVELFAGAAKRAIGDKPAKARAGRPPVSAEVVNLALSALAADRSERGREIALASYPIRGHRRTANPFPQVLRAVLDAAAGAAPSDIGAYVQAWKRLYEPKLQTVTGWDTESGQDWIDFVSLL